jgi:ADP-dependent NAD(P)H-hydrate dehydratase
MESAMSLPRLPPRPLDANKGDFGRALLIGGSAGMAGAIGLAGMACLRSGAGLVRLAVPDCIATAAAGFEPSYMTFPLPSDNGKIRVHPEDLANLTGLAEAATCVAIGPGLGQSVDLAAFVCAAYQTIAQPLVLDADAINALARTEKGWVGKPNGPRVLTPHPGEFARLVALDGFARAPRAEQVAKARLFARSEEVVLLLKGRETFITDGTNEVLNTTGNPGMATGGTGDVLTGIITALVCQGLPTFEAAVLAAHVHGLAGDLAAEDLGQVSLIASDLIRYLPRALQTVS